MRVRDLLDNEEFNVNADVHVFDLSNASPQEIETNHGSFEIPVEDAMDMYIAAINVDAGRMEIDVYDIGV